jgi:hypothetical protein
LEEEEDMAENGDPPATGRKSSRQATSKWRRREHALTDSEEPDEQAYFVIVILGLIYFALQTLFRMLWQ